MTSYLPPDYFSHDQAYQSRRARGALGWESADSTVYADMLSHVVPMLPSLPAASPDLAPKVLEIGCGAGNVSVQLAALGYQVSGVDISPTAIDWAKARAATSGVLVDFRVDNVVTLAHVADASVDAVVDGHCLHCIIGPDRARCLKTLRRVLKPGGTLVVLSMCGEVTNSRSLENFDPATRQLVNDNRPNRYIGLAADILAEVTAAGFDVVASSVVARKDDDDMEELIVQARAKPIARAMA